LDNVLSIAIVVALTVVSGIADAFGGLHASRVWRDNAIDVRELGLSAIGFAIGIGVYYIAVRFMRQAGIVTPEIQTTLWFIVMVVGLAILNGAFLRWELVDQVVAIAVIAGIGWLSIRGLS
jgi:hypothetical protein